MSTATLAGTSACRGSGFDAGSGDGSGAGSGAVASAGSGTAADLNVACSRAFSTAGTGGSLGRREGWPAALHSAGTAKAGSASDAGSGAGMTPRRRRARRLSVSEGFLHRHQHLLDAWSPVLIGRIHRRNTRCDATIAKGRTLANGLKSGKSFLAVVEQSREIIEFSVLELALRHIIPHRKLQIAG